MLLKPGTTCWRSVQTPRAAVFIDVEDYFAAVAQAIGNARRSVHILGWAFHPGTNCDPQLDCPDHALGHIAAVLKRVAQDRPDLDVRVLCWKAALPVAATQAFYPQRARQDFAGSGVRFVLDGRLPLGASHHQKVVVIDDAIAFCGGCDFGPDRWDTCDHEDDNPRRATHPGAQPCFDPRHEVMSLVDGAGAVGLGELFRERWRRATGESLPEPSGPTPQDPWPATVTPTFAEVRVGLSRSAAAWAGHPQIRENEALYLASIAAAKTCIYLENQYFTSPIIAEALAQRLGEANGPEVVLVSTAHSPSYFDRLTMDRTRSLFIARLRGADKHGRFHIYSPVTALGRTIIVHAKLAIIDDVLLRVGSSNINNRSLGLDTECDLSIEPLAGRRLETRRAIAALRTRLVAHWLGCPDALVTDALKGTGSLGGAIEHLRSRGHCRLRPVAPTSLKPLAALIATFHLGDPVGAQDSWRPWRRRRGLKAALARVVADLRRADLKTIRARLSPKTV